MNNCAAGVIERFFDVTIATGSAGNTTSTARGAIPRRLPLDRTLEADATVRTSPAAAIAKASWTEFVVTVRRGISNPLARNALETAPPKRHQGSLISSAGCILRRLIHLLLRP